MDLSYVFKKLLLKFLKFEVVKFCYYLNFFKQLLKSIVFLRLVLRSSYILYRNCYHFLFLKIENSGCIQMML